MSESQPQPQDPARNDPLQASPYRRQLDEGFRWLRFERLLEESYLRESFADTVARLRFTLGIVVLLAVAMIVMDTVILKASASGAIIVWRYGVLAPALLLALLSTFLRDAWRWYPRIVTALGPVIMAAATVLVVNIESQGNESIIGVLVLGITFIYYLVGLSFYSALITNAVGLVVFIVSSNIFGLPQPVMVYQLVILLFASVVGATLAQKLESLQRQSWLEQRMLEEMADRDGLTGIFNRRRLEVHMRAVWEQGTRDSRPVALLMVDVDSFKSFNDRYGHQAGDEALKQVANVLAGAARRPLDMAARYGGEEFVVLLYDTAHEHAVSVAERVVQEIRKLGIPHEASAASDVVTVSIGLAHVTPAVSRSMDGLVQLADQGVYIAKDSGGDRVEIMSQAEYAQMRTGWFDRNSLRK